MNSFFQCKSQNRLYWWSIDVNLKHVNLLNFIFSDYFIDYFIRNGRYLQVFEDCEKYYIYKREQLLNRIIKCSIEDLIIKFPRDHCTFIRSGGALMIRLCDDESNLYQQFFVNSDYRLLKYFIVICTLSYFNV